MKIEQFEKEFKQLNFVKFGKDKELILFSNLEVYHVETETSFYYTSMDEVLQHTHKGKTIKQYIDEAESLEMRLDGGRGAGGGGGSDLFGGQGSGGEELADDDLPAKMNRMYNGNEMSAAHTIQTFRDAHVTDKYESAIMYDDDGFVSSYVHGEKNYVGFLPSQVEGKHMAHNHPSGSNFSRADLDSFSSTGMKSLTASGKGQDYTITKTAKFDSNGFTKAVANAKTTETDYNKAVDRFLKSNQKKYGYKYTVTKYN